MKAAVAPLQTEVKKLQKENKKVVDKLSAVQNQINTMQNSMKEILVGQSKSKQSLSDLLKDEGLNLVKKSVFYNLHLKTGPEEDAVIAEVVKQLRENDYLVTDSAKALKDLAIGFHEERNILKQQVQIS